MIAELALLAFFFIMSYQDHRTGQVTGLIYVPVLLILAFFFPAVSLQMFVPVFGILLIMWWILIVLQRRVNSMNPKTVYLGLGDVLGVPFAVTLAQIFLPVLGPASFAACLLISLPWALRRKNIKLLPWLVPGVIAAAIGGILLAVFS